MSATNQKENQHLHSKILELKEKLNVYKISAKLSIEYKEAFPGYLFKKEE